MYPRKILEALKEKLKQTKRVNFRWEMRETEHPKDVELSICIQKQKGISFFLFATLLILYIQESAINLL